MYSVNVVLLALFLSSNTFSKQKYYFLRCNTFFSACTPTFFAKYLIQVFRSRFYLKQAYVIFVRENVAAMLFLFHSGEVHNDRFGLYDSWGVENEFFFHFLFLIIGLIFSQVQFIVRVQPYSPLFHSIKAIDQQKCRHCN